MFRVTVNWEQICYYEVTMVTNAKPGTQEWWDEALDDNMYDHADCFDSTEMNNITFTDEEIV
jgi:hypothetical protein